MKYIITFNYDDRESNQIEAIGHYFPSDVPGFCIVVVDNLDRIFVNLKDVTSIHIPKEVFVMQAPRDPSEVNG